VSGGHQRVSQCFRCGDRNGYRANAGFSGRRRQPRRIQLGTLTCSLSSSIGLIVGSQKNVNCIFRNQPGEPEEAYTGIMTTIGFDIDVTTGGIIV
jgi:Protein of unknown function (DUF992)